MHFGVEVVGIEVTKTLPFGDRGKDSPQAQASLAFKVMAQARTLYDAAGAPPLLVTAAFLAHTPLSGGRVATLSRAVAEFLQTHSSGFKLYQQDVVEPWKHNDKMPEICSLHFMRVPSSEDGNWTATASAWTRPAEESDIASVVSRKEKKISSYRSRMPTVWLLVVVELFEAGELVSAPDAIAPYTIATEFDRVFALNWLSGRVSEIPVMPREQPT